MTTGEIVVTIERKPLDIVPVFRLHLPDYNEAAWKVEGQYLYPEYASYEEYREAKESEQ